MSQNPNIRQPDSNACKRALLTLVARGSAIITELNRLIELVPGPFRTSPGRTNNVHHLDEQSNFNLRDLICDFSYFKNAEKFELRIEANQVLKRADEAICHTYIDILTRFYLTFESVQKYATDLNSYILELDEQVFVGQSLDGMLLSNESCQLICEAYFLLGCMLLTTDNNFDGSLREKLIVSYYRYSSYRSVPSSSIDETCNLLRDTGYKCPGQQVYKTTKRFDFFRPDGYPENLFSRASVNVSVVNILIAKLQAVDLYNQTTLIFPHPDHRSTALSQQASMLYVILYFCPGILMTQRSRMREIIDKFFSDNWIINVGMGELVNLFEAWHPYKAAKESLMQIFEPEIMKSLADNYSLRFDHVSRQIQDYLIDGWLNEITVLENYSKILNNIREANVVLKWILLHSQTQPEWQQLQSNQYSKIVKSGMRQVEILYGFLQNLAELERKFGKICDNILDFKNIQSQNRKRKALDTLQDLIDIFNDTKPMRWVQAGANIELVNSLVELKLNLEKLDLGNDNMPDQIINLISEINLSRETYSDGKNLQVVQLFDATKDNLLTILRLTEFTHDVKVVLHSITDFSYAWKIMNKTFTVQMQRLVKNDPLQVYGLKSTFLKLTSAFDNILLRIQQIDAQADLVSVSQYYSTKLVNYIRDVLLIIPASILELVSSIIEIQTRLVMHDLPSKVPLNELKDYALPNERYQMLELTYKVAHYAESMMLMKDTTIGSIKINSKQLLEDGIRRELNEKILESVRKTFNSQTDRSTFTHDLVSRLAHLKSIMTAYKQSFEYVQDYLFIYGLRMWQEELRQIVEHDVDQANQSLMGEFFLKSEPQLEIITLDRVSTSRDTKASSTREKSLPDGPSFTLAIIEEIISVTNPRSTIYDEQTSAWYEQKPPHDQVMDMKVFRLLVASLGTAGLNGIDQMCCTLLSLELQKLHKLIITSATESWKSNNQGMEKLIHFVGRFTELSKRDGSHKQVDRLMEDALIKLAPHNDQIINHLLRIGQLIIIRANISYILSNESRFEARNLFNCLDTLNTALLSTLEHGLAQEKEASQQCSANNPSLVPISHNADSRESLSDSDSEAASFVSVKHIAEHIHQQIEDSRCIYELTNHLEWIGLSDPMSKVYTLALATTDIAQVHESKGICIGLDVIFLILLDQCSKFHFSRSINGFVPKLSRNFYETSHTVDGLPLFNGIMVIVNHYDPYITKTTIAAERSKALNYLLEIMSSYVRLSLDQATKPQDLSLEVANMLLSIVELSRLARIDIKRHLPKFIIDTFQFTVCHLDYVKASV